MTTIFADFKTRTMVCDSKCTSGGIWYPLTKVYRIDDELIGFAGNVKEWKAYLKWYVSGRKGPRPKLESFSALTLNKDGLFDHDSDGLILQVERGFLGIGSGGDMATAAFMAGADPVKAVHIACAIDASSGGEIHTYTL